MLINYSINKTYIQFRRLPAKDHIAEQSCFNQTKQQTHPHITDEYIQGFGNKQSKCFSFFSFEINKNFIS